MRPSQCLHKLGNPEGALSVTLRRKKILHYAESFEFSLFLCIPKGAIKTEWGYCHRQQLPAACWKPGICAMFIITSRVNETVAASLQHLL